VLCLATVSVWFSLPALCSILLGPYVRFAGSDAATVKWLTTGTNSSIVEYGLTNSLGWRVEDPTPTTNHAVTITGLKARAKYYFVIKELINGQEVSSELFSFESDYNYSVPPAPAVPSPYTNDSMTQVYASVAEGSSTTRVWSAAIASITAVAMASWPTNWRAGRS